MGWIRFAILLVVTAVLQAGLLDAIAVSPLGVKPDLFLIVVVYLAITAQSRDAIITSFVSGFVSDIISIGATMGPGMLSYGILGTALAHTKRMVNLRKMPYQGLVIFVVGFLAGSLRYFFMFLAGNTEGINPHVDLLWEPLYSAVIGPFLFLPVGWWMRIKVQRFTR